MARSSAVKARTQATNQLKAMIVTGSPRFRQQLRHLSTPLLIAHCARLRPSPDLGDPEQATKTALRRLARRHQQLSAEITEADRELHQLVRDVAPALLDLPGVGSEVAGQVLISIGDNADRLKSEAAFAHLCGAAPIPTSRGRTHRHRLNRGGDRSANNALYVVVLGRMRHDPRTRAYVERRTHEGLAKPEIIRCLKRYVAREIYLQHTQSGDTSKEATITTCQTIGASTITGTSSARKREPGLDLAPRASLKVVTMAYGDDPHGVGLMTAGQFGRQTLLSAKALRIYAERGLLPPHFVDPINGYRYYAAEQVPTGWLISLLRSADLSLEQIRQIIGSDPVSALQHIEQAAVAIQRRSQAVQAVLHQARLRLLQEVDMTHISTTLEGDRPVLSVMKRMRPEDMDDIITSAVGRLRQLAAAAELTVTGDPFGVFHGPITADSDGPLEIALPVDDLADTNDDVRSYRLPGGIMANRLAEGPETSFPEILGLYDELHRWITDAGRVPVGPPRETWHNSPTGPEPLRLTISWPYASPAGQSSERQD